MTRPTQQWIQILSDEMNVMNEKQQELKIANGWDFNFWNGKNGSIRPMV